MRICTMWPSFPFTCCLLFIILTHKLAVSRNFSSIRIVLSCFLLIFYFEKFSTWIWRLPYTWCLNSPRYFFLIKLYCLGLHKSRVCFLWCFIWRGCKIFCQLEHEHLRSYCRVTRLNKLLFLFVLRKINMQCCPVPPFPCFLVALFSCSPVSLFPRYLVPLFPCSPVILFPVTLFPRFSVPLFPCSLVPLFPRYPVPPFLCSLVPLFPVTLFPSESVESFPCSSVNLKFFTQMKRPHNSVNGRGIFTCWVSERLISIFHRFWKGPFSRTEMPFYVLTFALVSLRNEAKLEFFFLTNENIWLFSFVSVILGPKR